MDKYEALRRYYGHKSFRPGQETLIDGLLAGRDVLGVMPTGGGKSVCYQIPALLLPGAAIVISPLISLMKDQVMALNTAGIPAAFLNSSMSAEEARETYRRAWAGEYKLLYVAPERLEAGGFLKLAQGLEISLVAVDEAHCVSQWGQDFRPHYLWIKDFLGSLPRRPAVGAFTATATGAVREDIVRLLGLQDPVTEITGFDRPNLYFDVLWPKDKRATLRRLVMERMGKSGIIYCATRREVERICEDLQDRGIPAARYHAGLEEEERRKNQDDFRFDRVQIMVATNAFGMGIDKSNVSYVIHYNMPKSLEAYYQEAGRAGRDGSPAECILLYGPGDVNTARFLIEHGRDNDALGEAERAAAVRRDYRRLDTMVGYCKTTECLRGYILDYFGQEHPKECGHCGTCRGEYETVDITREAQMVLSCVVRIHDKLGYDVGGSLIGQVLRGSRDKRISQLGLEELSTYGLLRGRTARQVGSYIERLLELGLLRKDPDHGSLSLAGEAREVLFRGKTVEMTVLVTPAEPVERREESEEPAVDEGLFQALKTLRSRLAKRDRVPPFMIFSNATLTDMARKRPKGVWDLMQVSGVGEKKADKYGAAFLLTIREYEESGG